MKRLLKIAALLITLIMFRVASADSPLADAVEKKDHAAIRKLLEKNIDVNASQTDGMTALLWAAYQDDLATAKDGVQQRPGADHRGVDDTLGYQLQHLVAAALGQWLLELEPPHQTTGDVLFQGRHQLFVGEVLQRHPVTGQAIRLPGVDPDSNTHLTLPTRDLV